MARAAPTAPHGVERLSAVLRTSLVRNCSSVAECIGGPCRRRRHARQSIGIPMPRIPTSSAGRRAKSTEAIRQACSSDAVSRGGSKINSLCNFTSWRPAKQIGLPVRSNGLTAAGRLGSKIPRHAKSSNSAFNSACRDYADCRPAPDRQSAHAAREGGSGATSACSGGVAFPRPRPNRCSQGQIKRAFSRK